MLISRLFELGLKVKARLGIPGGRRGIGMIVLQIGIGLIAVSVAAVTVYAILLLRKAKSTLREAELTIAEVRAGLQRISGEAEPLMRSARRLTDSVHERAASFDPMFGAVRQAGEAMQSASGSFRKLSDAWCDKADGVSETLSAKRNQSSDVADLAGLALQMWDTVQSLRSRQG